ncbi:nucleotide-binding domain-containing protein [Athelia psychrophila]|uniref:Nucleotide-binding domain-containing protein n=1 Tax=Athelia psychrophila TaxID=1759441 RepID=A0A166VSQ3_9AGAM|nr:nucleotide-binding domain-containing protein [Fibularhizoctonia sp. CBS 109695]
MTSPKTDDNSVVILGCGIIGLTTAYYLLTSSTPPASVHILDTSPTLFECASGRSGGFIARTELGVLSFRLHKELTEENDGGREWGYSGSLGISLSRIKEGADSETPTSDQLFDGQSRRFMTGEFSTAWTDGEWPSWLKRGVAKLLSTGETTAQVNSLQLCELLLRECLPEEVIPCTSLLLAAGPWTARAYKQLFPASELRLPISNFAGWSVVFRDESPPPSEDNALCHAAFIDMDGFSPEVFSQKLPNGQRDIFLAGVNSSQIPLPAITTDPLPRPITDNRTPIIARIDSKHYSPVASEGAGQGGLYVCAGHGPWGISLGPGSGKLCADMILGGEVPAYLSKLGL